MTGVLILRDPDPARRARCVAATKARLRMAGEPVVDGIEVGDVAVVWGAWAGAPVDAAVAGDVHAVVLGDLVDGDQHLSAADYAGRGWRPDGAPEPHDGYHLAVLVDPSGALSVDVDPLGLLPLYHWSEEGVVLATTAPGLLRAHERFTPRLDPLGLAGVLATDTLVAGRATLRGVRRLGAGRALVVEPDAAPREVRTTGISATDGLHGADLQDCATAIHEALDGAVRRHTAPTDAVTLLLSGGRDSRLMAGLLAGQGRRVEAVTFGERWDLEHRFARRVAGTLGLTHRLLPDAEDEGRFEELIAWHGLTCTPSVDLPDLGSGPPWVMSGLLMDTTWGRPAIHWARGPEGFTGAGPFLAEAGRHALPLDLLGRLLRREVFDGCVETVADDHRTAFEASGDSTMERAWRRGIEGRGRHWLGLNLWRQAHTAWPCIAHLDRRVLETAGSIPLIAFQGRRVQHEVLLRCYPELAAIPADNTSFTTTALAPRLPDLLRNSAERRLRLLATRARLPVPETRATTRTLTVERQGWADVRRRLEPHRELAYELFDPATFDGILAPADRPWIGKPTYPDSNGGKMLLAVLAMLADGIGL